MTNLKLDYQQTSSAKVSIFKVLGNSPVPWLFPLAMILVFVFLYPIVDMIRLSFTNANLISAEYDYTLSSYLTLFTSSGFSRMILITLFFVFFSVLFQMLLGCLIALLIDQGVKRGLTGTVMVRTSVLSAWAIPGVIIGIIWSMLYNESQIGVINYMLHSFFGWSLPFLSDPNVALISVTLANIWRGTAFSMIMIYAGLQTLPRDIIEAAMIDGANAIKRLVYVVIPTLAPLLLINLIIITVDTFNTFDMVMALTGGGPGQSTEVIALSIYNRIFREFELGQGAATAVVLLAINTLMTIIYFHYMEKKQVVA
ncbi:multiple sugar transport system permease protein [Caldalkalibacillus uzonensis]|uniref:Multiple sugar transport system permease protein n=1 Tax=Caldalkalibacillus uzonensis TaxID=353224 RepID=A0ABU0CQJ4_9BACI|nr:sugar ABC transporter permease [Caldalkalibacillus uzonensis]MDQ0338677.1 multiple sugar transport system permease protein [Caldalkalibacillus uzonensis]